jgi:hypothetical protein
MNLNRLTPREREHWLARLIDRKAASREAELRADQEIAANERGERDTALTNYYAMLDDPIAEPQRIGR